MANPYKFVVLFCLLLCFGNISAQQTKQQGIENPTFEKKGNCLGNWSLVCPSGYSAYRSNFARTFAGTTKSEYGTRKLTLRLGLDDEPGSVSKVEVSQVLDHLEAGAWYQLSVWVRADNLSGKSYLSVSGVNAANADDANVPAQELVYGTSSYSAWTKLVLLFQAQPKSSTRFTLGAETSRELCMDSRCGSVHFDNIALVPIDKPIKKDRISSHANVCEDSEFLNTMTEQCLALDKQFGKMTDGQTGPTKYISCESMNGDSINTTIATFGDAGGVVELGPCRVALKNAVVLRNNVALRGAGVGRTVLFRDPSWDSKDISLIRIRGSRYKQIHDITLSDITVQGSGPKPSIMNNIQVRYANNVLLERIESRNSGGSAISTRSSQKVTVRYVAGHGSVSWHGFESKECFMDISLDGNDKDLLVSKDECAFGTPDFFTEEIEIHSSYFFNNRGLGIDSHASYIEIAGNRSFDNGSASKLPEPANNVWVHHNEFSRSSREGMKIALQKRIGDDSLVPFNQVIYQNIFRDNRGYGIRIHERANNIYLIDNQFENNDHWNKLRIVKGWRPGKRVFICKSDQSANTGVDGHALDYVVLDADHSKCRLDNVANIFSH